MSNTSIYKKSNKLKTTEQFIIDAKNIHGDKFDYSLVEYIKSSIKVKIICPIHGEFEQSPNAHLSGRGCPKCFGDNQRILKQSNTEEFPTKANKIHGDKYDYSLVEYKNARTKVKIVCPEHGVFEQKPNSHLSGNGCPLCQGSPPQSVICLQCGNEFLKRVNQIKKTPKHFCSQSCACTYNNTHKTTGTRRSKLEIYLEEQLKSLYDFEIKFNSKDEINSELDIYIPHLRLAFELNGIFHYEPIYGNDKLNQTINNDNRKFQACSENNISLCIIDTTSQKYFKEQSSQKFLDIICEIIN